jgi:hypothetical protein
LDDVYVYPLCRVAIPAISVTCTSTVPGKPTGVTHVICVGDTTFTLVAGFPPKITAVVPEKFVPINVTEVPPAEGPLVGEIPVIVRLTGIIGTPKATATADQQAMLSVTLANSARYVPAGASRMYSLAEKSSSTSIEFVVRVNPDPASGFSPEAAPLTNIKSSEPVVTKDPTKMSPFIAEADLETSTETDAERPDASNKSILISISEAKLGVVIVAVVDTTDDIDGAFTT